MKVSWTIDDVLYLQRLESFGLTFRVDGDKLIAAPQRLIGPDVMAWIVDRKPALMVLVQGRSEWRRIEETL